MRTLAAFLLLSAILPRPALAESCTPVAIDVRRADVVAVARYGGDRTFVVESILRTTGELPAKLVVSDDWLTRPCAGQEPIAGEAYLVARFGSRGLAFRGVEETAFERALVERLHPVTAPQILDALKRYSRGEMERGDLYDWLESAMIDWKREESFTAELLEAAESLAIGIISSEACHRDVIGRMGTEELPRAVALIAKGLPEADTEADFIATRSRSAADPETRRRVQEDAHYEWQERLAALFEPMESMKTTLHELPWCDHKKYGW